MEITKEQIENFLAQAILHIDEFGREIAGEELWEKYSSGDFNLGKYLEIKSKTEQIKIHMQTLRDSSWEQFKNLASVSALCSTLLVIATFNNSILPYDNNVKFLLTILLFAIVISVIGFYFNFYLAQEKSFNALVSLTEDVGGKAKADEIRNLRKDNNARILGWIPLIANSLIVIVVLSIMYLIWK